MIDFSRVIDDVVLDCDTEPKTVFRIRSLNFDDELWIKGELDRLGPFPAESFAILQRRWAVAGEGAQLDGAEGKALAECSAFWSERERLRCIRGVIEIDRKQVSPEEVARKLGDLPAPVRDLVQSELAERIMGLGCPPPKSEPPSESPHGCGRILVTPVGGANNAG